MLEDAPCVAIFAGIGGHVKEVLSCVGSLSIVTAAADLRCSLNSIYRPGTPQDG